MSNIPENGIVLINKPAGMTSFRVTSAVRRRLGAKKAGHAGTLDPLAGGVLPVMIGRAARLIDLIPCETKRYIAGFMLGMTTDTLDNEGEVLTEQPVHVTKAEVKNAVAAFFGEIAQIPPMYSALKKDGKKLYELAREGVEIERAARRVHIYRMELRSLQAFSDTLIGEIDVTCSKGTYIRSLIDDIGAYLHCGAMMTSLCRVESNGFSIKECVPFDEFMSCRDPEKYCLPPDSALRGMPKVFVTAAQAKRFANGGELDVIRLNIPAVAESAADRSEDEAGDASQGGDLFCVYSNEEFCGVGELRDGALFPKCVF